MRLGLVLAEVGERAGVKVEDDEVDQGARRAGPRNIPGQEKEVWDYYRKNPQALAEIRAPLFEEKVVDHIIGAGQGHRRDRVARGAVQAGGRALEAGRAAEPQPDLEAAGRGADDEATADSSRSASRGCRADAARRDRSGIARRRGLWRAAAHTWT